MSSSEIQATPAGQSLDNNESAATSVNGSTATNETTTTNNTETSSVPAEVTTTAPEIQAPVQKPASAPPKVNPWKVRAEQMPSTTRTKSHDGAQSQSTPAVAETAAVDETTSSTNSVPTATSSLHKKGHKPSKSTAPAIDDTTLWPTLDKAVEERSETQKKQQQQTNGDSSETAAPSAPKVTGKEKWTKYTPTITYTPIPSKAARGASTGPKSGSRGGAVPRSGGREKSTTENGEVGGEAAVKSSRSSETSRPRVPKARSQSVSHTRVERPGRSDSQQSREIDASLIAPAARSQSSKRSDKGSVSAPTGNTPVSEASKSPQVGALNGASSEFPAPVNGELRASRGSYDSAFAPRGGRGGYRGTRANYQNNFNAGRYQNPAYAQQQQQAHYQAAPRAYHPREQMPFAYDQYQNFVNPSLAPVMIDPMVARQMVLNQCEYYFSIENLCKDLFLRRHMDADGFVNLPILAKFNRVRAITMDYALIRDVCHASTIIELRATPGAYDKIRRAEGWEQWVLPEDQRDASTKETPVAAPEIPAEATEEGGNMSSNIGAPAFVPGQSAPTTATTDDGAPPNTNTLTENFANLGMGRKLSPDVKEFKTARSE